MGCQQAADLIRNHISFLHRSWCFFPVSRHPLAFPLSLWRISSVPHRKQSFKNQSFLHPRLLLSRYRASRSDVPAARLVLFRAFRPGAVERYSADGASQHLSAAHLPVNLCQSGDEQVTSWTKMKTTQKQLQDLKKATRD